MIKYIKRYLENWVGEDLNRKMVFIGGPRQTGKTTLAKEMCRQAGFDVKTRYLTWDAAEDRENIIREQFPAGPVFEELFGRRWLKRKESDIGSR